MLSRNPVSSEDRCMKCEAFSLISSNSHSLSGMVNHLLFPLFESYMMCNLQTLRASEPLLYSSPPLPDDLINV